MSSFEAALTEIQRRARSVHAQGEQFERLIAAALARHPGIYGDRFTQVWRWADWPGHRYADIGIDLVAAEAQGGGLCAIQCKFYAADRAVPKGAIDSFMSASEPAQFTSRLLVNTGQPLRHHALRVLLDSPTPCKVLDRNQLAGWDVDWSRYVDRPADLQFNEVDRHRPYPYQREAIDHVRQGFADHARGQLILPCGTGKTEVALWLAEEMVGAGGRVLYLVPSIALMAQTMRVWAEQKNVPHRYVGICSDTRTGRTDEDVSLLELDFPVTTDPARIQQALQRMTPGALTVVFCTYQSLPLIAEAQAAGAPDFDLAICDEAHRTTGVEKQDAAGDTVGSPFLLVHDAQRLRATKRLYATGTPRLYTEGAKTKAARLERDLFSMDDPDIYGPEFYHMPFAQAVEEGWLADYKVVVLALRSDAVAAQVQDLLAQPQSKGLNLEDAVRLLGCWDALADPEGKLAAQARTGDMHKPMQRAIAFTSRIKQSQLVATHWNDVIAAVSQQQSGGGADLLTCQIDHVDGTYNSLDRTRKLGWLNEGEAGVCRVLSNARCLTEGVDVPALDAVLFLGARRSQVDVVQAVGRVMRRAPGKQFGYIILPIVIPPGKDPEHELNRDKAFQSLWDVVRALRSHDERFDALIHSLDLNVRGPGPIIIIDGAGKGAGGDNGDDDGDVVQPPLPLDLICKIPPGAIYARIVEKCGDRKYWPQWAEDVADIADRIRTRITALLGDAQYQTLHRAFAEFLAALRATLHGSLQEPDLVAMVAQHMVTEPVFSALFGDHSFTRHNPVSKALQGLVEHLAALGLDNETRDLAPFYASVRRRAGALDNPAARQTVLLELYERFFKYALKKDAERLGIVYTPVEVVDFILHSADHALQTHFKRRLSSEQVHVLDPFTGTGTFLARLLQNRDLIGDADLLRKYTRELHANEIVLLAYYIAAINIEAAFNGRRGPGEYTPFEGIVFTDTFNLTEGRGQFPATFPVNSERAGSQQQRDITVIVGNPPYSAGQQSASDDNPNVSYPQLARRIELTYAARSAAGLKKSLYDSYKLAIRWACDRIGAAGVVAFVTNGSFIDGNAEAGLRACLSEEFSHLYVFNLRGNQRTQGERSRREGGKVFGSGSRTPVAIMVLVRDPSHRGACEIRYKDIGDYLTRAEKLEIVRGFESIGGITDWQTLQPDAHHDWMDQRDPEFQSFLPLAVKGTKSQVGTGALCSLSSFGIVTNRDAWIYGFDREILEQRVARMTSFYEQRRGMVAQGQCTAAQATMNDSPSAIKWTRGLRGTLRRDIQMTYDPRKMRVGMYRPFCKQYVYFEPRCIEIVSRIPAMFPTPDAPNQVIGATGRGETVAFSTFITDTVPNLHLIASAQWVSRWRYEPLDPDSRDAWMKGDDSQEPYIVSGYRRVDNITDWGLAQFRQQYDAPHIRKDDIWHYLYGLLHVPQYRERYQADLSKDLPRMPLVSSFDKVRAAGGELAALHLGYETCPLYPLEVEVKQEGTDTYRLGPRPMQWGGSRQDPDRSVLQVTPRVTLRGIPDAAHLYVVNGRTPLEWAVDRLHIRQDQESGIVNDPNAWFASAPDQVVAHLQRLVQVSVETQRIVEGLRADIPDFSQV